MYKPFAAFLLLLAPLYALSQIQPTEGKTLNYRLIPFSFVTEKNDRKCKIEVAKGNYNSLDSFTENIILSVNVTGNKTIIEVPYFKTEYTWRITGSKNKALQEKILHHFATGYAPNLDTTNVRLRIKKSAEKYKDGYVFSDLHKVLYDMEGKAVWYMPVVPGIVDNNSVVRDMKLSCAGTITFLSNDKPYEIDFNGKLLWRAPRAGVVSGDSTEHFHHQVTRMKNGDYMVLGNQMVGMRWERDSTGDSTLVAIDKKAAPRRGDRTHRLTASYGTIIEYDRTGKIVWYWQSSSYYQGTLFRNCQTQKPILDLHENAFDYDEKNGNIYISFKNINQIIKLKYPSGEVTNILGTLYYIGEPCSDTALFWEQHAVKVSKEGYIYLFNNNINKPNDPPTVIMMEEPKGSKYYLKKIWEYQYPIDMSGQRRLPLTNGGNVIELPDGSIYVSMCTPYGNQYIVSRDKELLWDAVLEKYNQTEKKWIPSSQYRGSIITNKKDLEELIWNANPVTK